MKCWILKLLLGIAICTNAQTSDFVEQYDKFNNLFNTGYYTKAEVHLDYCLNYLESAGQGDVPLYTTLLLLKVKLLTIRGQYNEADTLGFYCLKRIEIDPGKYSFSYINCLRVIASVLRTVNLADSSLYYLYVAEEIGVELFGKDSSDYIIILDDIANTYYHQGYIYKALEQFEINQKLMLSDNNIDQRHVAMNYNSIGVCYSAMLDYPRAIKSYRQGLEYLNINLDVSVAYSNIANVHRKSGHIDSSLFYLKLAQEYLNPNYIEDKLELSYLDELIARVYYQIGNLTQASYYIYKSIDVAKLYYYRDDKELIDKFALAAEINYTYGNYNTAKAIFRYNVSTLYSKNALISDAGLADITNLIKCHYALNEFDTILDIINLVKNMLKGAAQDWPQYKILLSTTEATLFMDEGKYIEAIRGFNYANELMRNEASNGNDYTLLRLYNLTLNNDSVLSIVKRIRSSQIQRQKVTLNLSGSEDLNLSTALIENELLLTELAICGTPDCMSLYTEIVFNSFGVRTTHTLDVLESLKASIDSIDFVGYQECKRILYAFPNFVDKEFNDSLKHQINYYESKYMIDSLYEDRLSIEWQDIQMKLLDNEAVVIYSGTTSVFKSSDTKYYATIIRTGWESPKTIELCYKGQIGLTGDITRVIRNSRGAKNINENIEDIYSKIWKPIEQFLSDISVIYLIPTGQLTQIPFSAIRDEQNKLLLDRYLFNQLVSLEDFKVANDKSIVSVAPALVIGGINYNDGKYNCSVTIQDKADSTTISNQELSWQYLPGTLKEIKNISGIYSHYNLTYTSKTGKEPTEDWFKELAYNDYSVIHIASHGIFTQYKSININTIGDHPLKLENIANPLIRCGLIFANANNLNSAEFTKCPKEDGFLSGYEISLLDMRKVNLVVLSACETGVGDVNNSEGVYGLQMAFRLAGVNNIVMSLWSVPDYETAEFMTEFYTYWLSGEPINTAFHKTQSSMANKYPQEISKWAGFILVQ